MRQQCGAKALEAVGWLAYDQGDIDRAVAAAEEGLRLSAEAEIQGSVAASFRICWDHGVDTRRLRAGDGALRRKPRAQPGRR